MAKDEWMRAAMTDDSLVVELLFRLKQSQATATAAAAVASPSSPNPLPMTWTVRMPRSKALRCDQAAVSLRNKLAGEFSARCSPTTPLSWSAGAASPSTADAGIDEDSGLSQSLPRSKGVAINQELGNSNATTTSRRCRKKKTFTELKEDENLLLKENAVLKKELTKLRATFKEQSTENQSLKRIKLELGFHGSKRPTPPRQQYLRTTPAVSNFSLQSSLSTQPIHHRGYTQIESCGGESKAPTIENRPGFFLLPDLNSLPCEDDWNVAD